MIISSNGTNKNVISWNQIIAIIYTAKGIFIHINKHEQQ